jgi:hypothetical protein
LVAKATRTWQLSRIALLGPSFLDLVKRLCDQEALESVTGHEGERRLEKIEAPQRGELVQHEQQPMPAPELEG